MNERTIFLEALAKDSTAERATYLAQACSGDLSLRQRIEQLLQSHQEAGEFLATPALEPQAEPTDAGRGDDVALDFLAPSQKPGSQGLLDHYEVLEVVGRGGMGVVLRAFDEKLHRVVALKVMAREIAGSAPARKRFSREAKAAAAVVHDHIVPIHAIEETGPVPYLVMQYIEGQSLQKKIDDEGSLELNEILRIGTQIASGLAAAHKQGLVHRDIKPANILLENGVQRVKITDFGLARAVDDASVSQTGVVAGTPQYMSPEQADGEPVDRRSDLFSLGSVLYAMCTGRPPFRAASTVATLKRVCEDTPRPIHELNPDMPEWLCDIIGKLHAKSPTERFQSAQEVADLLEQHLAQVQQSSLVRLPPPVARHPVPARSRRSRLKFVVLAGLLLLALASATWLLVFPDQIGSLEIGTDDPDLIVTLDGQLVKLNPITGGFEPRSAWGSMSIGLSVRQGPHRVQALKDGKLVYDEMANVEPGKTVRVFLGGGPVDVDSSRTSLNGHWVFVAAEYKGRPVAPEEAKDAYPSELIIKGDQCGMVWAGKQQEGGVRINPKKNPAEIDFTGSVFSVFKPRMAIYELIGDRLKLCLPFVGPKADPPRPTSFKTDPQSKNVLLIYRREHSTTSTQSNVQGQKPKVEKP
jgi:uncharacterized protein (TIGR03067 family)